MRLLKRAAILAFGLIALIFLAFAISPWPTVLVIRGVFDADSRARNIALSASVKPDVIEVLDQPYGNEAVETLNIFYQGQAGVTPKARPAIVWIHGGAFIAGQKEDLTGYLKILASEGFTTIAVGYGTAPVTKYPIPLKQIQRALDYISTNAEQLGVDRNNIFLSGDSAGAQLVAQSALIVANAEYAAETGIQSLLSANQLKGLLLWCGVYDPRLGDGNGIIGHFVRTVMQSYFGEKVPSPNNKNIGQFTIINQDLSKMPPVFISVGNEDPLEAQSRALADKLGQNGQTPETLFFDEDHQPPLGHEYQFQLKTIDGQTAFDRMLTFLRNQIS